MDKGRRGSKNPKIFGTSYMDGPLCFLLDKLMINSIDIVSPISFFQERLLRLRRLARERERPARPQPPPSAQPANPSAAAAAEEAGGAADAAWAAVPEGEQ